MIIRYGVPAVNRAFPDFSSDFHLYLMRLSSNRAEVCYTVSVAGGIPRDERKLRTVSEELKERTENETESMPETVPQNDVIDPENPLPNGSYFAQQKQKHRDEFPLPVLVTLIYLVLGFVFHKWHPGWLIFLTIPLYYLPSEEQRFPRILANPVMITIIYFVLGFGFKLWHPGWLIFLAIPLLNWATSRKK